MSYIVDTQTELPLFPGALIRVFDTGATRDGDANKIDYEGHLSPLVLQRFGQYMHEKRVMADGSRRDSDNWQKGIPKEQYVKSLIRHTMDVWMNNRNYKADEDMETALCAIIFNAMGLLHEIEKEKLV
jgi:hypothetical protein